MTCHSCANTVRQAIASVGGVQSVSVDQKTGAAVVHMERHIPVGELQTALASHPRYSIAEKEMHQEEEAPRSWWQRYKPVLLVFFYISSITLLLALQLNLSWQAWMRYFMSGFFLVFSFFKMLDLRGFADSYAGYDLIGRQWRPWGYVYAFIELALGLAFLLGLAPVATNAFTFAVMGIGLAGVLRSVLSKRTIRCACLGTVFNIPMSTVTIVEDGLMMLMSACMLIDIL